MRKKLAALFATTLTVGGGVLIEDITSADLVTTLNDPITLNQAMEFRAPSHTVEVSDNGLIELVVAGDKRYGIMPSDAAGKDKGLFLDIESSEKEVTIKEAFGSGSEITIKNTPRSFSKVVSLTEDFLKTVPKNAQYVEVSFDLNGWEVPDGAYTERIQLQKDVWLEKALAWDSSEGDPHNDIPNSNYTDVEFVIADGKLTKRIPIEWLKTAQFPIYTDATFTFGTKELADVGPIGTVDVLPIGTDKAAICWTDNANASQEGRCLVATVSGTDLTFGSISDFSADTVGTSNNQAMGACPAGNDRWVVMFADDADSDDGTARVASSTGTTINGYGTAFDFDDGVLVGYPVCAYVATDKVIIAWSDGTNTSAQVVACDIASNYTLSCGSVETFRDTANIPLDMSCAATGTDKFICTYSEANVFSGNITAGSVSGTTITLGAEVPSFLKSDLGHTITSPAEDKFFVVDPQSSNAGALGTISGVTITLGATTTAILATTTSFVAVTSINENQVVFMFQQGATDAATTFLSAIPIELDFNTLTFSTSTAEQIDATTDPGSLHAAQISTCKFLFAWEDDNDTNDLFAVVGDLVGCGAVAPDDGFFWFD